MHTSIWDTDVQAVFDGAKVRGMKRVQVGGEVVEITVQALKVLLEET
jgi:hypothetical protein